MTESNTPAAGPQAGTPEAAAPASTRTCAQCATPVAIPAGEASAKCPACGALVRTGGGTHFGLGWRFAIAGNVLFIIVAGFAILVAANWLANKYFIRRDATLSNAYTLSETTKLLLQKLGEDKQKVRVYFLTGQTDYKTYEVVQHTLAVLEEYKLISAGMVEFQEVSLFSMQVRDVCKTTDVKPEDIEENEVLFYCDATKKNKSVKFYELYESEGGGMPGQDAEASYKFKGEAVLTAGLQEVTEAKKTILCFTTGHGELQLDDFQRRGLSDLDRQLKSRENFETKELNLAGEGKIPEDASAVVIVRPKTKFAPSELEALRSYLDGGGRLAVIFNSNAEESTKDPQDIDDLVTLFSIWGVEVGKDYVIEGDPERTKISMGKTDTGLELASTTNPTDFNVVEYGYHDITKKLEGTATWFIIARSVSKAPQVPEGITVAELARTSANSGAINETVRGRQPEPGEFKRGPVSVAVAVEKATPGGAKDAPRTRILLLGDADGLTNLVNQQFGRNPLFANGLRWLVGREHLISGIEPVEQSDPKLNLTKADQNRVGKITLVAMPGVLVLLAVATWFLRRK